MKRKLFFLLCALLTSAGMWAQKDVTSQYITNATLSSLTGWTVSNFNTPVNGYHYDKDNGSNATEGYATEAYAGWEGLYVTSFSLTQNITLPAGHYTLVNYSFFRQGQNYDTNKTKSLAFLKAGENQVAIKTLGSITAASYANSQWEGADCFDSKMYRNALDFTIDVDNTTIQIGLTGTFDEMRSWCILGMFELIDNDTPATLAAPFDVTGYITNPGFEYRDMSGWTVSPSSYFGTQKNNQSFKSGWYYAEKWQASGALPEGSMSQTLTDLPAGYYKLSANLGGNGTYIDLNGKTASWTEDKDYTVGYVLAENEDLVITAGKTGEGTANWIHFDQFKLQFCGDVAAALTTLLNEAKDILDDDDVKMSSSARTALQTAYTTYNHSYSDVDELLAAIDAMQDALDDAQESIDIYTDINTAISAYATKASALDAAGQAAYDASGVVTKYNNGTYETLAEAVADLQAALAVAAKAQTTNGADMTDAIANPSFETGDVTGWTAGSGAGLYIRSTQGELSNKVGTYYALFQKNGARSVSQTVNALSGGKYILSVNAKADTDAGDVTLSLGAFSTPIPSNAVAATYKVAYESEESANVAIQIAGANGEGTSRRCYFDYFTLTYYTELPDVDVTDLAAKAMNGTVKTALTGASSTYASAKTATNYNALQTAIINAQISADAYSVYATYEAKAQANLTEVGIAAFHSDATVALYYNGTYDGTETNEADIKTAYVNALKAEGAGYDWTSLMTNPSFEEGTSGWSAQYSATAERSWSSVTEGEPTDGTHALKKWTANGWFTGFAVDQAVTLPVGYYRLTADVKSTNVSVNTYIFASTNTTWSGKDMTTLATANVEEANNWESLEAVFYVDAEKTVYLGVTTEGPNNAGGTYADYYADNFHLTYLGNTSVNLTVSDGKLGTFIAPFDVELPDNVKAYSATSSDTKVILAKIKVGGETLSAGTPVIIYGDGVSVNKNFYGNSSVSENQTVGALTGILKDSEKTISSGKYVLQTKSETQAFYQLNVDATGKLNRCYVTANVASEARLVISYEDEVPTAINAIEAADTKAEGLKDGKYFIGNKIVLVKNGVKFNANGQILK